MTASARDPWRWWYRLVLGVSLLSDLTIGYVFCAPSLGRLYGTSSMRAIRDYTVPWPVWGAVWFAAGLMLLHPRTRMGGYFTAMVTAAILTIYCFSYGILAGKVANLPISLLAMQSALLQAAGIRYWAIVRSRPKVATALIDGTAS